MLGTAVTSPSIDWTGFTVSQYGPNNPISPASKNHMMRATSGYGTAGFTSGPYAFGDNEGTLYSFAYACAEPKKPKTSARMPVACTITVTQSLPIVNFGAGGGETWVQNVTLDYVPELIPGPGGAGYQIGMMGIAGPGWQGSASPGFPSGYQSVDNGIYNYTFSAVQADGSPAWLYLDTVVYNIWES